MDLRDAVIFVDLEASGLEGYPIEVGWGIVYADPDRDIEVESHLFVHPPWLDDLSQWDMKAEKIHGVTIEALKREGKSPRAVAERMNDLFEGADLYSDFVEGDRHWTEMLFAAAGIPKKFKIVNWAKTFDQIDRMAYDLAEREASEFAPITHRSGADARHNAALFKLARDGWA